MTLGASFSSAVAAWPFIAVGVALAVGALLALGWRRVRPRSRAEPKRNRAESAFTHRAPPEPAAPDAPEPAAPDAAEPAAPGAPERPVHDPTEPAVANGPDPTAREALALALRHGVPFAGLRGFEANPLLFAYLPRGIALAERAVPVLLIDDHLKVASATPHPDLRVVRERFPLLTVDVVVSPATEVDLVLAHALRQG
ncbi:MAG TPA: hypothetical protein VGY97_03115 [Solirubrobacteraceae bacterium]|nr:hypothetical protein [Solirubrobacteraceae bacterium]